MQQLHKAQVSPSKLWISTLTEHPDSVVKGYTVAKEVLGLKFAKRRDEIYTLAPCKYGQ